ncbi:MULTISPECIES: hypothetical protein [Mycobacteriaceae]|uniref:Uncharacterized protein n=1 Tax=Mycolicibacterium novocastrense TaxID=59813 RepID=A0ABQ0KG79_MYCNV|nr:MULTISPECIES: hypothetical protein [Mycobacteriaceae]GAT08404.1 uncharacterized protein RMCN_1537 [Mycolicibacterium novocastrense]
MQSNDLFSHPQKPEFTSNEDHSTEPVTNPVFSDRPERGPSTPSA